MNAGNEPAYPLTYNTGKFGNEVHVFNGLTKREYLAAMAMQGLMGRRWEDDKGNVPDNLFEIWAKGAFKAADAMIAEAEKEG